MLLAGMEAKTSTEQHSNANDSYFGWDQLLLLLTPFPVHFVARIVWILGGDNNAHDTIAGLWVWPFFGFAMSSLLIGPILLAAATIGFAIRQIWKRRWKHLVPYGLVLIVLPLVLKFTDTDYLRFKLQQKQYEEQVRLSKDGNEAVHCFVFDTVIDNFYMGGMNFDPYQKIIIFIPKNTEIPGQKDNSSIYNVPNFSPGSKCRSPSRVTDFRHLSGRYYMGRNDLSDRKWD